MADDFDVEALLEAPYKKEPNGEVSSSFSDILNFRYCYDDGFQRFTDWEGLYG